MSAPTLAHELKAYTDGMAAWSLPKTFKAQLVSKTVNQFGTCYRFADGSRAFVRKGSATVWAQGE